MDQKVRDEMKEEFELERINWREERSKLETKLQEKTSENEKVNTILVKYKKDLEYSHLMRSLWVNKKLYISKNLDLALILALYVGLNFPTKVFNLKK